MPIRLYRASRVALRSEASSEASSSFNKISATAGQVMMSPLAWPLCDCHIAHRSLFTLLQVPMVKGRILHFCHLSCCQYQAGTEQTDRFRCIHECCNLCYDLQHQTQIQGALCQYKTKVVSSQHLLNAMMHHSMVQRRSGAAFHWSI